MTKRMLIMSLVLLLVFGGVFGWKAVGNYFMHRHFATFEPPPEAVATAKAGLARWQSSIEAVGSVRAVAGIDVSTEVAGMVKTINFESGRRVARGELLVQLDDAVDRAQLDGLVAAQKLAESNLRREEVVAKQKLSSAADLDTARSRLEQAQAQVQQQREQIAKKAIRAPFAGELGIRRVDPGQYIAPGAALVSLVQPDPIYVEFSVPEQSLARVNPGAKVKVRVASWPDRSFAGSVTAIDSRVDEATRNVRVQATLENRERLLRPGMFADVELLLPEQPEYVTLPRTALSTSLYGDFVYVIEPDGSDAKGQPQLKAVQHFVKAGPTRQKELAVLEGVKAGDEVVIAGQFKLHNGSRVFVDNSVALK